MHVILSKELRHYLATPAGYIIIAIFLLATGLMLWIIPGTWNILDNVYANLDGFFTLAPWLYLFLIPALTMTLFPTEYNTDTWEILRTQPISPTQITLGKYFAAFIIILIALLPTLLWYITVYLLGEPLGNIDTGAFCGACLGLILLAADYAAIGSFISAHSRNPLVAFLVTAAVCFLAFYGFELLGTLIPNSTIAYRISLWGINEHYQSISRGVIDSRDLIYFLSIPIIFLTLTIQAIKHK